MDNLRWNVGDEIRLNAERGWPAVTGHVVGIESRPDGEVVYEIKWDTSEPNNYFSSRSA